MSADKKTDNTFENLLPVKTKWEGPFIYEPPGGDLNKDWFVWLKYQHPVTGKMERAGRFSFGFSDYKTKSERRQYGLALKIVIEDLLKSGWSPYDEYNIFEQQADRSIVSLIKKYLAHCESSVPEILRPNTFKKYTIELNLFKKWLEKNNYSERQLDEINKSTIRDFLEESREERKWKAKTYNDYLNDITTFFNYYLNNFDDIITKVPTRNLTRYKRAKPGNKAWTDWQFKTLKESMLENGDELLYIFCSFVYYAALRNESEAIFLKAGDFNFNTKTLKIDSGTAKNRTTEYIPIYPDFLQLLYKLEIDKMPANFYIFGKPESARSLSSKHFQIGAPYRLGIDFFASKFRPYKNAMGIPKREHGIYKYKHTRCQHLGEDGEDLYKIMKLFRHRDLATTMIYMEGLGINTQHREYTKGRSF